MTCSCGVVILGLVTSVRAPSDWLKAKSQLLFPVNEVCFNLPKQTNSKPLPISHLKRMDEVYDFTPSKNSEIKFR